MWITITRMIKHDSNHRSAKVSSKIDCCNTKSWVSPAQVLFHHHGVELPWPALTKNSTSENNLQLVFSYRSKRFAFGDGNQFHIHIFPFSYSNYCLCPSVQNRQRVAHSGLSVIGMHIGFDWMLNKSPFSRIHFNKKTSFASISSTFWYLTRHPFRTGPQTASISSPGRTKRNSP